MRALDRLNLRGYLAWLTELGYVRHSVSRKLSTLRTFLKWMSRKGIIEGDPLPKRGIMRVPKRLPRFLSQEQAERLMDAPDTTKPTGLRDQALLEVIYGAGAARKRGEQSACNGPQSFHARDPGPGKGIEGACRPHRRDRERAHLRCTCGTGVQSWRARAAE